jgi:hypothetical protein
VPFVAAPIAQRYPGLATPDCAPGDALVYGLQSTLQTKNPHLDAGFRLSAKWSVYWLST